MVLTSLIKKNKDLHPLSTIATMEFGVELTLQLARHFDSDQLYRTAELFIAPYNHSVTKAMRKKKGAHEAHPQPQQRD